MLSINLDEEAEKYLVQILKQEEVVVSELIKQLLRDRANTFSKPTTAPKRQTILERMGGMPEHLASIGGLSDRDVRKAVIAEHVKARHRARHDA